MTVLIFILVLLVTVLVHEWGHYFAAKRSGMQVDEFGFGIPPRIGGWKRGKTLFSINALPIGGFVTIAGEQPGEKRTDVPVDRLFSNRPRYQQAVVLLAGVVCNFLLAWVLFSVSFSVGVPRASTSGIPEVVSVQKEGPASMAGIAMGDKLVSARVGSKTQERPTTEKLQDLLKDIKEGEKLTLTVDRNGTLETYSITPARDPQTNTNRIGIAAVPIEIVQLPLLKAIIEGFNETVYVAKNVVFSLGILVKSMITGGEGIKSFVGPVGLATAVSHASQVGLSYFLSFVALISVNLAVLNLIPFPALDGGRLVIVGLEALTRRKFDVFVVNIIHLVGFALLILLMIVLTVQDIKQLG